MPSQPPPSIDDPQAEPGDWLDRLLCRAPAILASVIVHLLVLIVLAVISLRLRTTETLVLEIAAADNSPEVAVDTLVIEPAKPDLKPANERPVFVETPRISEPLDPGDDFSPVSAVPSLPSDDTLGRAFLTRVQYARKHGIEIVVVFDSTGSMSSEIAGVKARIQQIGKAVLGKIPRARFSLVTYRDGGEDYVARGMELTGEIDHAHSFISHVSAAGGGDHPEAVDAGMKWAIERNTYRSAAQKVMLIFGDAPPHRERVQACVEFANRFKDLPHASVSTVTCRKAEPLPEFYLIAQAGNGEAFVMNDYRRLLEQLLVIAFGAADREQVLQFFDIDENPPSPKRQRRPFRRRRLR